MKLIDLTANLRINDAQPVVIFEASKNAFVILAEFKGELDNVENPTKKDLKAILLSSYSLLSDGKYVYIHCAEYDEKVNNTARVYLTLGIKDHPVLEKNLDIINLKDQVFDIGKGIDEIEFHLSFDISQCEGGGHVNNGDWPCNKITVA